MRSPAARVEAAIRWLLSALLATAMGSAHAATDFSGIAAISAGAHHTCAVTTGGAAMCWGSNASGQLGDGTRIDRYHPVSVAGLSSGVTAIAAGDTHTCAITTGGALKCWGDNSSGGFGDGTTTSSTTPVDVAGLTSGVARVSAGGRYTCAVTLAGGVKCWGDNSNLQLGIAGGSSSIPQDVPSLAAGVVSVTGGFNYTCALLATGGVKCWGSNFTGGLGDGSPITFPPYTRSTPGDVLGLTSGVSAIAQDDHTCAIVAGGALKCWGSDLYAELGDGVINFAQPVPVSTAGISGVSAVAAGSSFTCALAAGGAVSCWGRNDVGQAGNGTSGFDYFRVFAPTPVTGLASGVAAIAAGYSHACAIVPGGAVRCWGSNSYGELGDGTYIMRSVPVAVTPQTGTTPSVSLSPSSDTGISSVDGITAITRPVFTGTCVSGDLVSLYADANPVLPTATCAGSSYSITPATPLAEGAHAITATATLAGGESAPSAPLSVTIDTVAPVASLACTPPASVADSAATFCISATDGTGSGVAGLECALDGAAFASCTSPRDLAALAIGPHTFAVRASDVAGNVQNPPATFSWTVLADTVPDPFSFPALADVAPLVFVSSAAITVTGINAPSPISVANGSYSIGCTGTFTTSAGTVLAGQKVCVGHIAGAANATVTTTLTIGGVSAAFTSTAADVLLTPKALDFSGFPGGISTPKTVTILNQTSGSVAIVSVTISGPFALTNDCGTLAAGASCTASIAFTPTALGPASGTLTVLTAAGSRTVSLSGNGIFSLVEHYYNAILRRPSDPSGNAFWSSEITRVSGLGASVNEVFYAMGTAFFFSPEYLAFGRNDTDFVTDLYQAFFVRAPDAPGIAYWTGLLAAGMPREVLLANFLLSTEFTAYVQSIYGNRGAREEVNVVGDFYRGILGRLADTPGFNFWVAQFRAAQCVAPGTAAALAVASQAESISSQFALGSEYTARARSDAQYVGDLYNAFLRRGGELSGVQFWIGQVATKAQTREQVRMAFVASLEFSTRVAAVIVQGCLPLPP
jgi:alpha-tubulin suppressor-like RCC1 family protein